MTSATVVVTTPPVATSATSMSVTNITLTLQVGGATVNTFENVNPSVGFSYNVTTAVGTVLGTKTYSLTAYSTTATDANFYCAWTGGPTSATSNNIYQGVLSGSQLTVNFVYQGYVKISGTNYFKINATFTITDAIQYQPLYQAIFTETGLPLPYSWGINLSGNSYMTSADTITVNNLANGTYSYDVIAFSPYVADPASGNITINSINASTTIAFAQYEAVFTTSGLTAGVDWGVWIDGVAYSTTASSLSIYGINGNVQHTWGIISKLTSNWTVTPSSGNFTFSSAVFNQALTFSGYTGVEHVIAFNDGMSISDSYNILPIFGTGSYATAYVEPAAHTNFTVAYTSGATGYAVAAYNIDCIRQVNQASTLKFTVSKNNAASFPLGGNVQFWYLGNIVFNGFVIDVNKKSTMEYDITAADGLWNATMSLNIGFTSASYLSQLIYNMINKCKIDGTAIKTANIQALTGDYYFQNNIIVNTATLIALQAGNYYLYLNNNNQIEMRHYNTGTTVTFTENANNIMVQKKIVDTTYQYTQISLQYILSALVSGIIITPPNPFPSVATSSSTNSQTIKTIDETWLYTTATVAEGYANNLQTSFANGYEYAIIEGSNFYDITANNNYTINFADGTVWTGLTLIKFEVTQAGTFATFANLDVSPFSYVAATAIN